MKERRGDLVQGAEIFCVAVCVDQAVSLPWNIGVLPIKLTDGGSSKNVTIG